MSWILDLSTLLSRLFVVRMYIYTAGYAELPVVLSYLLRWLVYHMLSKMKRTHLFRAAHAWSFSPLFFSSGFCTNIVCTRTDCCLLLYLNMSTPEYYWCCCIPIELYRTTLLASRELRRQSFTLLLLSWIVQRLDLSRACLLLFFLLLCYFFLLVCRFFFLFRSLRCWTLGT